MDPRVRDVLQVLESSWWTPPRVAELARRVGLGPSQLEHLFLREVQTTIRAFITQQRMCAAARLLTASHGRISTIAFEVGFNHVANFNHAFKKHFGLSPREYRHTAYVGVTRAECAKNQSIAELTNSLPAATTMRSAIINARYDARGSI